MPGAVHKEKESHEEAVSIHLQIKNKDLDKRQTGQDIDLGVLVHRTVRE